jgi:hypothetical protein
MAIRFSCACGKELQAQEEHAGKKTKCPACGAELRIPVSSAQVRRPAEEEVARSKRRAANDDFDDQIVERPAKRSRQVDYDEEDDRPSRPKAARTSGKAIFCLILGLLSVGCSVLTAIPAVILGFLSLRDVSAGKGLVKGKGLAITGMVMSVLCMICNETLIPTGWFGFLKIQSASHKAASRNNLNQIGIAMHNFQSTNGRFPAVAVKPNDRQPLLSWRVMLLPYLGEDKLYGQFRLDEPWDSANNKRLLTPMPKVFADPAASDATTAAGKTHYRVFYGQGAFFDPTVTLPAQGFPGPTLGVQIWDITDGMSNTIMAVEAADPVEWTKPDELRFDRNAPLPKLGVLEDGFFVLMADGSARFINKPYDEKVIKAAITRNGGELVTLP